MADEEIAAVIRSRRIHLMMSQSELAAAAGVSEATVRSIEASRRTNLRSSTRRSLCQALGWTPDSIDRILAGDEPVEASPEAGYDLGAEMAEIRDRLDVIEAELGIRSGPGRKTPQEQADELAAWNKQRSDEAIARLSRASADARESETSETA